MTSKAYVRLLLILCYSLTFSMFLAPVLAKSGSMRSETGSVTSSPYPEDDAYNVELVGQIGGKTKAIAAKGNYVYLGEGLNFTNLDVSDPTSSVVAGRTALPGTVLDIALASDTAYIAAGISGLQIVDISNPTLPNRIGYLDIPNSAEGLDVAGDFAYITGGDSYDSGLRIIDISNPAAPVETAYKAGAEFGDVIVEGNYAYLVGSFGNGMLILDVSDPTSPLDTAYFEAAYVSDIAVSGNHAYIAQFNGDLRVVDISNPAEPFEIGYCDTLWEPKAVDVSGEYLYVANPNGLQIVDVSDPTDPFLAGSYEYGGDWTELVLEGNKVYVASEYDGLLILDITEPVTPSEGGVYEREKLEFAESVALQGDFAYVGDSASNSLLVVDVSNPTKPIIVGRVGDMPTQSVAVAEDHALIGGGSDLHIVDVSNPLSPVVVGSYKSSSDYITDIAISNNHAYIAAGNLTIIDISDPASPEEVSQGPDAEAVAVSGDYAYLATTFMHGSGPTYVKGMRIVNIANPSSPVETAFYETEYGAESVAAEGKYAYYAGTSVDYGGLHIIEVSDPIAPTGGGYVATKGHLHSVSVTDKLAYLAAGDNGGLRVIYIANPTAPGVVGFHDTPGSTRDVDASDNYAYLADGPDGLVIARYNGSTDPARIIVDKVTAPAGAWVGFDFSLTGPDNVNWEFVLDDSHEPWDSGYLKPGVYELVESPQFGWIQESATCDDGSDPTAILLEEGETITCTFTNKKLTPPTADFAASPDTGAPPLIVNFTNLSTGDFDQCRWDFGDGGSLSTCENSVHQYNHEGQFKVSLAVKGPVGEDTKTVENCVNVSYFQVFLPSVSRTK